MRNLPSVWPSVERALSPRSRERSSREGGFLTLIGLLVVIVIIGILFAMYGMPTGGTGAGGPGSSPATIAGGAKVRAQGVVCQNNLQQLRAAVSIYQANNQSNPPSLESLNAGVSLVCPVGGEPYQYDPTTGRVQCVHPGHESF